MASSKPWFNNTLFVITGDHGCRDLPNTPYAAPYFQPQVLMMLYTPNGMIKPGSSNAIMNQYDIGPTVLDALGYDKPFVALGQSVLNPSAEPFALGWFNGAYQVVGRNYIIILDPTMKSVEAVYDKGGDPFMRTALKNYDRNEVNALQTQAQAFYQDYAKRLNTNKMSAKKEQ